MEEVENLASHKHNQFQEHDDDEVDDDISILPGFRFHPTDEELVGFYLLRKVQNRLITLDFIKQTDIYKFDPWDLPKSASSVGENEWYFFCKRGRKYKNSIRPNRVTGSGFWKATGIDRHIYAAGDRERRHCIGLKKSLVYYRGSAGKGTKTEWMMHEFRLPPQHHKSTAATISAHPKNIAQEAEVWTLCRILKRKSMLEWKELTAAKRNSSNPSAETCSSRSKESLSSNLQENYISFSNPLINNVNVTNKHSHDEERPFGISVNVSRNDNVDYHIFYGSHQQLLRGQQINNINQVSQSHYPPYPPPPAANSFSSFTSATPEIINGFPKHADWEELRSVILGFSTHP